MKARKKPVIIECFQYDPAESFPVWAQGKAVIDPTSMQIVIETLEGTHRASPGDYIIQGVKGEVYPCRKDIFEETYDVLVEFTTQPVVGVVHSVVV